MQKELIRDFRFGLKAFGRAYAFIREHRLRHYFIYPLVLSIVYWISGYQVVESLTQWVSDSVHGRLDLAITPVEEGTFSFFWSMIETVKGLFNQGYTVILAIVVRIIMWLLFFVLAKYILLAVLSPMLALLSERSEEILTGRKLPFDWTQFLKDIGRGILVAMRNMLAELGLLTVLWILTFFIPILAPATLVVSFTISAFYYGFSLLDYIQERERKGLSESFSFMRAHRGLAVALGLGVAAGMALPLIGFIIASFVSILGAVAAVIAIHERQSLPPKPEKLDA